MLGNSNEWKVSAGAVDERDAETRVCRLVQIQRQFPQGTSADTFDSLGALEPAVNPNLRTKATVADGITSSVASADDCVRVVEYQPGNGSRYVVLFSFINRPDPPADPTDVGNGVLRSTSLPIKGLELLGRGDAQNAITKRLVQATLFQGGAGRSLIVGGTEAIHWVYVKEKLGVSEPDAVVLAELIGEVCWLEAMSCEQYEAFREQRSG